MTIQVRPHTYRRVEGFLISGTPPPRGPGDSNRRVSIFTHTRSSAEKIRAKVKAGREIEWEDWQE